MFLLHNRIIRAFTFLLMFAGVAPGCSSQEASFPSTILGYNHTSNAIIEYRMKLDQGASANGMSILPHSGGGSFVCCMPMPRRWNENLKVTVSITELVEGKEREREVIVPIPRYDGEYMNYFNIHFLRGGKVKIFLRGTGMRKNNYPLQGAEADLGGPK